MSVGGVYVSNARALGPSDVLDFVLTQHGIDSYLFGLIRDVDVGPFAVVLPFEPSAAIMEAIETAVMLAMPSDVRLRYYAASDFEVASAAFNLSGFEALGPYVTPITYLKTPRR